MQQIVKSNQRLEKNLQDLDRKYREVSGKDKEHIAQLTYQLEQAKNKLVNDGNELNKQIESLKEEKENLLEQLRTKSTGSASFRKQQSEIDSLKQQLKERENVLIDTQEELKFIKESLEQLQDISQQEEDQRETVAASTQTEVRYESKGSVYHVGNETMAPETRNWGIQAMDESLSKKISKLEQENKNLTGDKQTISAQLEQKIEESGKLKKNLRQLQEENRQLKQKATKDAGVNASSSTDQKETKEMEVQTDVKKADFRDLYDEKGKYVRTELSDPNLTSAEDSEKSRLI